MKYKILQIFLGVSLLSIYGCQPNYISDQEMLEYRQILEQKLKNDYKRYLAKDVIKWGENKGDKVYLYYTLPSSKAQLDNEIVERNRLMLTLSKEGKILNAEERKIKSISSGLKRDRMERFFEDTKSSTTTP